jgi:hypothetical protein
MTFDFILSRICVALKECAINIKYKNFKSYHLKGSINFYNNDKFSQLVVNFTKEMLELFF